MAKPNLPYKTLVPGVIGLPELLKLLVKWDEQERCVKLWGKFYKGKEIQLFPENWLVQAAEVATRLSIESRNDWYGSGDFSSGFASGVRKPLKGLQRAMGCDPAEGGDSSSWTVGDELGLCYQLSKKTPDTTVVVDTTIQLMHEFDVDPANILFDRGGGGYEHACVLRKMGLNVRTVGFGEGVTPEKRHGVTPLAHRKVQDEQRYTFINRRSEMYGMFSEAINPGNGQPYGIPLQMVELRRQLGLIPKLRDREGRLWLPPKNKPPGVEKSNVVTLFDILGCSPDEADSAVLCYYGLYKPVYKSRAGVPT